MKRKNFLALLTGIPFGTAFLSSCNNRINNITNSNQNPPQNLESFPSSASTTNIIPAVSTAPPIILPKKGAAPSWDNKIWINSEPLSLNNLRGKVVLLEFWTFDCYNCQNVMPALKSLYLDFKDKGFEIVGMHDPEFEREKKLENVQQAVKQRGLKYPVAQDNDFNTWNKYGVRAWPTLFLIDKLGFIRYNHIGEGAYDETRANIESLLNEPAL